MQTKKIILPLLLLGGGVALFLIVGSPSDTSMPHPPKEKQKVSVASTPIATLAPQAKEEKVVSIKVQKQSEQKIELRKKVVSAYAFEPLEIEEALKKHPHKTKVPPLSAFEYKQGTIRSLSQGDEITILDVEGIDYALTINKRKLSKRGTVTLNASLENPEGVITNSVLTEGKRVAFVTLNTPNGTYEIESFDGVAYLYASSDIRNNMIDFSKSDVRQKREK